MFLRIQIAVLTRFLAWHGCRLVPALNNPRVFAVRSSGENLNNPRVKWAIATLTRLLSEGKETTS